MSPRCSVQPLRLHLLRPSNFDPRSKRTILHLPLGLPRLSGSPICISAKPHLKAYRGKLVSGLDKRGMPVHAASFIRARTIVLETQLLGRAGKLKLILVHELFHFVWARLGNRKRAEYTAIVAHELRSRARGEVGESAEGWKQGLGEGGALKNYICESFCDTAAWLFSGVRRNQEVTLSLRWRSRRVQWFYSTFISVHPC